MLSILFLALAMLSPVNQAASGHDQIQDQAEDWGFVIDDPKDRPIFIAQFLATGNEEALDLLAATDQERADAQLRIDTQAGGNDVRQRAIQEFGDAYGGAYNDGTEIVILSTEQRDFEGARVVVTDHSIAELESIADAINADAAAQRQDAQAGVVQRIGDVIVFVSMSEDSDLDLSAYPQEVLEVRRGEEPIKVGQPNATHNPTADRMPGMKISLWKEDGALGQTPSEVEGCTWGFNGHKQNQAGTKDFYYLVTSGHCRPVSEGGSVDGATTKLDVHHNDVNPVIWLDGRWYHQRLTIFTDSGRVRGRVNQGNNCYHTNVGGGHPCNLRITAVPDGGNEMVGDFRCATLGETELFDCGLIIAINIPAGIQIINREVDFATDQGDSGSGVIAGTNGWGIIYGKWPTCIGDPSLNNCGIYTRLDQAELALGINICITNDCL